MAALSSLDHQFHHGTHLRYSIRELGRCLNQYLDLFMQPLEFDVIVVGAGPAGVAAAFRLRKNNLKVLILDRSDFPREKPCGGGLTVKSLALMPYSIAPIIEHVTTGFDIGLFSNGAPQIKSFDRGSDICAFVVRSKFDLFNLEKTQNEGATFKIVPAIDHIEQYQNHIEIKCGAKTYRAKYLIGADGANSRVRRLVFPTNGFYRGFAIEGLVPYTALKSIPTAEFLLGFIESGYGWVFPKADHANVGVYTNRADISLSKDQLRAYVRLRLSTDEIDHINGYPLGFGGENFWQTNGRVVLVGDAGGYAEPLLGEGLHNAIKSGQLAAQAIVELETGRINGTLSSQIKKTSKPIRQDVKRCRDIAHQVLYPHLNGFGGRALMHPVSRYVLLKGFAAGQTTRAMTNRFPLAGVMRPQQVASITDYHKAQ